MSVLINMEMPTSCRDCRFCNGQADTDYGVCAWCDVDGKARDAYTMQDCPLVPVPPHGDLIDVEAFLATQREIYCENCERRKGMKNGKMRFVYDVGDAPCRACDIRDVLDALEDAPTIIPADPPVMYYPQVPGITPTVIAEEGE